MSRWLAHAGERGLLLRLGVLLVGACSVIAAAVAFLLFQRHQVGVAGLVGVALVGPLAGAALTALTWMAAGLARRSLVHGLTAAGNIKRAASFSYQESLVARGRYAEAEESYRAHVAAQPGDLDARLALAALHRDHLEDPVGAERLMLEARHLGPTLAQEFAIGNALIDLYRATRQTGRELAELARFADRFGGTEAGRAAREAIRRLKAVNR